VVASVTSPKRSRVVSAIGSVSLELVAPAVIVSLWWLLSSGSKSVYFPSLSSILTSLRHVWLFSHFGSDAVPSLERLAAGLGIAAAVGIGTGVVLGLSRAASDAIAPILEFARAIPAVALLPTAVLLLGIGPRMQITMIAYGALWPILLSTAEGVRSVDPVVADVTRSYRIRQSDRLLRITLPAASPQIVAGMRTALSIGIALIVFSEMVGSSGGIGFQILAAQRSFAVSDMWAGMILLGILGYVLNVAFRGFEHVVLGWHRGLRQTAR
jgi:ABC-type nitrate/sulfonate/bicarbonate transport system permease component